MPLMATEQRPLIPQEIKREVRQRCGFGCVLCGIPLYQYDHMLEWVETHKHVANEITLLCDRHHSEKTKGLLSKEAVKEANDNPYNRRTGVSQNYLLHYSGKDVKITIGENIFQYQNLKEGYLFAPLVIDLLPIISFKADQGRWQEELTNLEALAENTDLVWDNFFKQLDSLEKYRLFGFDFTTTLEQKKELLNVLLEEFILDNDGKIELRFKVPLNEEQVAEKICTLSRGVNTCIDRIVLPYFPVIFRLLRKQVA
ncbi:cell division protein [Chloroflexota bacterium]